MALFEQVAEGVEVAERLGHLRALHQQMLHVHPAPDEGLAVGGLALGDLVLVVREDEVHASRVDVYGPSEYTPHHGRALNVPAGAAPAEGGLPVRLALFGRLPERKIAGVVLGVLVGVVAQTALHLACVQAREPAVRFEFRYAEVKRAVLFVDDAFFVKAGYDVDHVVDRFGRARVVLHRLDVQGRQILEEDVGVAGGVLGQAHALARGAGDRLVVYVGDVHRVVHPEAAEFQVAPQKIVEDEGAEVSYMGVSVDCRPAGIDCDGGIVRYLLFLFAAGDEFLG
ncbi:MAG: hypothetical protein BWY96_03108 [Spirochaetes bacterium ADurb.BinA120]|nr:MAG: hypothetical protein BWY96_03108 [Spirochaetes bacterium ADurb.BinA120]